MTAGLTFSLNAMNVRYCLDTVGFPPTKTNIDGQLIYGLVLLPVFIYEMCKDEKHKIFTSKDIIYANLGIFFVTISIVSGTFAMKYGKPETCQAIDCLKVIFMTGIMIPVSGLIPSLVQVVGMLCGVLGAFIVIF